MKKVLENAILLIIAAALFIGVYTYIKADEPKEDEIVDVETDETEEVELYEMTIDCSSIEGMDDIIIQYEKGMTWGEWIESEYNTSGFNLEEQDGGGDSIVKFNDFYLRYLPNHSTAVSDHYVEYNHSSSYGYVLEQ